MRLVFVSGEARGVPLTWMRETGLEIKLHKRTKTKVFVRPFDPLHDALYIPNDKFNPFCLERENRRLEESDLRSDKSLETKGISSMLPYLSRSWEVIRLMN